MQQGILRSKWGKALKSVGSKSIANRSKIDKYMRYYNSERKQWTRKKMTPVAYRNHLLTHRVTG